MFSDSPPGFYGFQLDKMSSNGIGLLHFQPNTRKKQKKQQQLALFGCREAQKCQILLDLVVGLKKKKKKKKILFCCVNWACVVMCLCVGGCVGGGVVQVLTIASGKLLQSVMVRNWNGKFLSFQFKELSVCSGNFLQFVMERSYQCHL